MLKYELLLEKHSLVIYNCVKNVERFKKAIGFLVFDQNLIKFTGSDKEEDGRNGIKALEPFLPLRPLTTHVHESERNVMNADTELSD